MLLSVYKLVQQPQGAAAAAAQPGVKQEVFCPQGGPAVQLRHDRLAVAPAPPQQQHKPKQEPTSPGSQTQQQHQQVKSLTVSPAEAGQQQRPVKAEGIL
jgi:hypothetical protein